MSDNFHDAFEEGIRDNAGNLALAGALMAHSQRKQQLQSLEASRRHQAEIAKTEAERLEVEKQRLKIEKLRHQIEKDEKEAERLEKEAVRLLRVMMAEVGAEFDGLASRGQLKGSPPGVRRDYAMAVLLSKLILIRSRSSSLSDLNDLKELSRLENLEQDLVIQHFAGRDPLHVARSKWQEIEAWMQAADQLKSEVKQACSVVPDPTAVQLPSKDDLAEKRRHLEEFSKQLPVRFEAHVGQLPVDAAVDGHVYPELAEQAQLEDLTAGKQTNRAYAFANRWRMVAKVKCPLEPGMLAAKESQPELGVTVEMALTQLGEWQTRELTHETELQALAAALEEGRLEDAESCAKKLGNLKFAGLNYLPVENLKELKREIEALAAAKRGKATREASAIRAKYPRADPQSVLAKLLNTHQARAHGEKIKVAIISIVLLGLIGAGAKVAIDHQRKQQRLAEEKRQILLMHLQKTIVGSHVDISLANEILQAFSSVRAGNFSMGSPSDEEGRSSDEEQVEVTLRQPFWLAKTEVTQAHWEAVMGSNPSKFKGPNLPVESVSWEDAQAFIAKLNERQILPQGWEFALPTETQWEYACRAGEKGPYSGGILDEVGWHDTNSESRTNDVGQKKPNAWGLYDMHGNVWEWCADRYEDKLTAGADPNSFSRVFRGGSWNRNASGCRAASRITSAPNYSNINLGFRLAIVPSS